MSYFVYIGSVVSGPFNLTEIEDVVATSGADTLVWWRGQREWITVTAWRERLPTLLTTAPEPASIWYTENLGDQRGPFTRPELTSYLLSLRQLQDVRLWTQGMATWTGVYNLYEIMDSLGISRRETERAPLHGKARVTHTDGDTRAFFMQTATIGAGGLGLIGPHGLSFGDEISITIESADLESIVHARGRVQYTSAGNYVGIQFLHPHAELLSIIADHVRRFAGPVARRVSRAA